MQKLWQACVDETGRRVIDGRLSEEAARSIYMQMFDDPGEAETMTRAAVAARDAELRRNRRHDGGDIKAALAEVGRCGRMH